MTESTNDNDPVTAQGLEGGMTRSVTLSVRQQKAVVRMRSHSLGG